MLTVWVLYRDLEISGRTKAASQKNHLSRERENGQGTKAGSSSPQSLQCRSTPEAMDMPAARSAVLSPCSRQLSLWINVCATASANSSSHRTRQSQTHFLLIICFCPSWHRENGGMWLPKPHFTIPPFDAFFPALAAAANYMCIMMDSYPLSKEWFEHHRQFFENSSMLTSCPKGTHNVLRKE